jgi:hypothetical protein
MKTLGTGVLVWGTKNETWGLCESLELSPESEKEAVKDGEGATAGLIYYDMKLKCTGEFTPVSGAVMPVDDDYLAVKGSVIEITPKGETTARKFYIDEFSKKYKKAGAMTFNFTGYNYPKITFPSA